MSQIPQTYLHVATIKSETTSSIPKCELLCMNTQGCYSININIADANTNKFVCTLLRENLYAKPNYLVKHNSFIHLYIEVRHFIQVDFVPLSGSIRAVTHTYLLAISYFAYFVVI